MAEQRPVPITDLKVQYGQIKEEIDAAIAGIIHQVFRTCWVRVARHVQELCRAYSIVGWNEGTHLAQATTLLREVADALEYAHRHEVVHRDIKPDNVLLPQGGGGALLADFGLARELSGGSDLSQTGQAIGTPGFWAPEQARGEVRALNARTDVYGLGGTLYAAWTGLPPVTGESLHHVVPVEHVMRALDHAAQPVEPGRVAEDVADGDVLLAVLRELGPTRRDPLVVVHQSRLGLQVERGRGHPLCGAEAHRQRVRLPRIAVIRTGATPQIHHHFTAMATAAPPSVRPSCRRNVSSTALNSG